MELEFNINKEYLGDELLFYTKPIKGDNKICNICLDSNKAYDKYKLSCGHKVHTRCFRRFCYFKEKCNICPLCDVIEPYKEFKKYIK